MRAKWIAMFFALVAMPALADVNSMSLRELVNESLVIAVGRVTSVVPGINGQVLAMVTVQRVWKGVTGRLLVFDIARRSENDISDAKVGEEVLLFLGRSQTKDPWSLVDQGRGRWPVRKLNGRFYASVPPDSFSLPGDLQIVHSNGEALVDLQRLAIATGLKVRGSY